MRRNFEYLAPHIKTVIEVQRPSEEMKYDGRIIILPGRKRYRYRILRFIFDIYVDFRVSRTLMRESLKSEIELIIIHFLTNAAQHRRVFLKCKKPVFVHCHGIDVTWEQYSVTRKWRKLWWGNYAEKVKQLPVNVSFVANSVWTKGKLKEIGIESSRIHVNNPGVPIPQEVPKKDPQKKWLKFLFLGRLVDVKGPDLTIKAFEKACREGLHGELIIAGDGNLRYACEKLIRESEFSDRIKMLGYVSAKEGEKLRQEADVFTAHSRKGPDSLQEEAFGVAFIEAMSYELPVVTGASGSLPEIIRNGIDGILFEPGDIDAHARSLIEIAENAEKRISMGLSGAQRVKNMFSVERENQGLKRIYVL